MRRRLRNLRRLAARYGREVVVAPGTSHYKLVHPDLPPLTTPNSPRNEAHSLKALERDLKKYSKPQKGPTK